MLLYQRSVMQSCGPRSKFLREAKLTLTFSSQTTLCCLRRRTKKAVRDVLDTFCNLSGQKVSNEKSRVFFSPNIAPNLRSEFADTLGFRSTPSLGKYLGFLIKHIGINQDFSFIIERIQSRLARWKANLLSFPGRLVLTQVVASTIPDYIMQCPPPPSQKILQNIDCLSRNFL